MGTILHTALIFKMISGYLLDDSNECSELSKSEIFGANNRAAYILFYERIAEQQIVGL